MKPAKPAPPRLKQRSCAQAVALCLALSVPPAFAHPGTHDVTSVITVTNCDDSGPGSLRDAIAGAASGDTIDLSSLTCSTITLTGGEIQIAQDDLTVKYAGEGGTPPTIDGNNASRVFDHTGSGTLTLEGLKVQYGKYSTGYFGTVGGCVRSSGSVYLAGSTLTHCIAIEQNGRNGAGGALYAEAGVRMVNSVVSDSSASSNGTSSGGGGILSRGPVALYYSTVSDNMASGQGGLAIGGGIAVITAAGASSTIVSSTVSGNVADHGGGIFASGIGTDSTDLMIQNSTVSGNHANVIASGIYLRGSLELFNSTIAFNTSPIGPGILLDAPAPANALFSTIVADNDGRDIDSAGPVSISGANNLVMVSGNGVTLPPDTSTADPLLLPLANNGGPTETHALGSGSPALDAGDNVLNLTVDQRGGSHARAVGAAADIGAFEQQAIDDTIFANGFDP